MASFPNEPDGGGFFIIKAVPQRLAGLKITDETRGSPDNIYNALTTFGPNSLCPIGPFL